MADQLRAGGRLALRLLGRRGTPRILQAAPPPVHLHRVRPRPGRALGCVISKEAFFEKVLFTSVCRAVCVSGNSATPSSISAVPRTHKQAYKQT